MYLVKFWFCLAVRPGVGLLDREVALVLAL